MNSKNPKNNTNPQVDDQTVQSVNNQCSCGQDQACSCSEVEAKIQEQNLLIEKLQNDNTENNEKLIKVLADYQNMQRDNDKRLDIALTQLKAKTAGEIIAVLDDLNFALQAKEKIEISQSEVEVWINGLIATMRKMENALSALGVKTMTVNAGDQFDSGIHEAIGVVYEGPENTVHQVVQSGYEMLDGEVIVRPARVIVSKTK